MTGTAARRQFRLLRDKRRLHPNSINWRDPANVEAAILGHMPLVEAIAARYTSVRCSHVAIEAAVQLLTDNGLTAVVDWSGRVPVINPL